MRLLVLSDTHARRPEEVSAEIIRAVEEADLAVHCGDFVGHAVLEALRKASRRFVGVHGNLDAGDVRQELPARETLELEGKKIAITHPAYGGPPWGLEEKVLREFPGVDIIFFGHTHEPLKAYRSGVLLFNPGQGYGSSRSPGSYGLITLEGGEIEAEIVFLGGGRS
jgi:putative phosphoesterase